MARMVREFHRSARGPVLNDEDWWRLVFDTETGRLFVQHEWAYLDARRGGPPANAMREIEIPDALAGRLPRQAHAKLVELLGSLFEVDDGK